jgi:hypothetical protein
MITTTEKEANSNNDHSKKPSIKLSKLKPVTPLSLFKPNELLNKPIVVPPRVVSENSSKQPQKLFHYEATYDPNKRTTMIIEDKKKW